MLIDVARAVGLLGRPDDPARDDTILDLSVGYDLAGVRSPAVRSWIASMKDARAEVEALRREIPDEHRRLRDLDFRTALSDQVTLSTFHGCPANEIEAMAVFLMEEMGLHVTVKLNPTLLGKEAVDGLLHDVLGYDGRRDAGGGLRAGPAVGPGARDDRPARRSGRARSAASSASSSRTPWWCATTAAFFPPGEAVMYLSGAPLHVITLGLVERFRRARPEVPLSFSAGVDNRNFADCVALGLAPVTVCTDLLKPGGYSRLPKYLENLEERMRGLGVRTVGDFVVKACGTGEAALESAFPPSPLREELLASLRSDRVDLRAVLAAAGQEARYDELVRTGAVLNTPLVVARATADPRYRAGSLRPPRRIGRHLALFDCINCDKCLPACPNDANFVYETEPFAAREYESYRVEGGHAVPVAGGRFEVRERHQIGTFQDFCNDCGNCDTFCPEDGGPYLEKPRFFGSLAAFRGQGTLDGFYVESGQGERHDVGAPGRRRVPPRRGPGGGSGRLHRRARDARAAPRGARAGRSVRRARHARRPHPRRRRLPEDGRPARRRPRPRAAPTP